MSINVLMTLSQNVFLDGISINNRQEIVNLFGKYFRNVYIKSKVLLIYDSVLYPNNLKHKLYSFIVR